MTTLGIKKGMSFIKEAEIELSKASEVLFMPTSDLEKEPSVVMLLFSTDKIQEAMPIFNDLSLKYDPYQLTMTVLVQSNMKIDLSIIDVDSADSINIKGLNYDPQSFKEFCEVTPSTWRFVILIGFKDISGMPSYLRSIKPVALAGYSVTDIVS